jgi:hypothetical protein
LFDGQLSPFLFLLPLVGTLTLKHDPGRVKSEKLFLLGFSFMFVLIAFFKSNMRIRYIAPITPPLVILATYGLNTIVMTIIRWKSSIRSINLTKLANWSGICVAMIVIMMNLPYTVQQWRFVDPLPYLQGTVTETAYITQYRPEYELYRFANVSLDRDAKVMALFLGNRGYRCERDVVFDIAGFQRELVSAKDAMELSAALRRQGVSHLMINHQLFNPWAESNFTVRQLQHLSNFFHNGIRPLLTTKSKHALYELRSVESDSG